MVICDSECRILLSIEHFTICIEKALGTVCQDRLLVNVLSFFASHLHMRPVAGQAGVDVNTTLTTFTDFQDICENRLNHEIFRLSSVL